MGENLKNDNQQKNTKVGHHREKATYKKKDLVRLKVGRKKKTTRDTVRTSLNRK